MRIAKVDVNQKEIVTQLRAIGCAVLHTHQLKNAFDVLVGYRKQLYIIEIKKNKKAKLTEGEMKCKELFESVGVDYHVVTCIEDFIGIIKELN